MDEEIYLNSVEKKLRKFKLPFQLFVDTQRAAGIMLIICILVSLILINIPNITASYSKTINSQLGILLGESLYKFSLISFVNDFLLTFFFFLLGLEIKREFVVGELSQLKRASLVSMAAMGGVILPAIMYISLNYHSSELTQGWAIPTATDTAIAIGVFSFYKHRLPRGIFSFIAALAVLDDIFAVVVIALFYSHGIHVNYLLIGMLMISIMVIINLLGFKHMLFYAVPGVLLWLCFIYAGIHAAVVGVVVAFTVPARPKTTPYYFIERVQQLIKYFKKRYDVTQHILKKDSLYNIIEQVHDESLKATIPLKRWGYKLEKIVFFVILPLFVFVNGAIILDPKILTIALHHSVFWGILLGLLIGKPLGIITFVYISLKTGLGKMPSDMRFIDMVTVGLIASIGYTMSIFVASLAFESSLYEDIAKIAVIFSSIIALIGSSIIINSVRRKLD